MRQTCSTMARQISESSALFNWNKIFHVFHIGCASGQPRGLRSSSFACSLFFIFIFLIAWSSSNGVILFRRDSMRAHTMLCCLVDSLHSLTPCCSIVSLWSHAFIASLCVPIFWRFGPASNRKEKDDSKVQGVQKGVKT